ncbi:hypothetical protein VPNG_08760 [Cytospora leucostoma]|uniref:DUF7598 domain-containing protein n=1 Tax=Cytospora leucostoma TaxID=1230097 RepID=A0A423VXF8_9PEZI|nr:hypothetical protein VPNG_08760 [Cytospora leucostoma]
MSEGGKWLGPAWWILQLLRVGSIIALLSIAASSVMMVVKTHIFNSFFFFQDFGHFITCSVALLLVVSELPQFGPVRDFYRRNWPAFSTVDACNRGHSLAWLGVWMAAMGIYMMGCLNEDGLLERLTLPLWRLTLASGILALVFGCFNLIVSVLFRSSAHGITVRMVREHGANVYNARTMIMPPEYGIDTSSLGRSASSGSHSDSIHREKRSAANRFTQNFSHNVAQNFNFSNKLRQNRLTGIFSKDKKPQISGPMNLRPAQDRDVEAQYPHQEHHHEEEVIPDNLEVESWEGRDRASPIAPHVQRPPTALHPAYTARSSYYSEVSHLNRF